MSKDLLRKYADIITEWAGEGSYDDRQGVFNDDGTENPNVWFVKLNEHTPQIYDTHEEAKRAVHELADMIEDGDVISVGMTYSYDMAHRNPQNY